MPKVRSGKVTRLAVAGVLLVATVAFGVLMLAVGDGGSRSGLKSSVPLAAGAMTALLVLLVFAARPGSEELKGPTQPICAACGKPLIEGSRLCPHCCRLTGRDVSLTTEGDRPDG